MKRVALLALLLCAACGGSSAYTLAGEWDYGIYDVAGPLTCKNRGVGTGTMVVYVDGDVLSGSYDICAASVASADLAGRTHPGTFELQLFGGAVEVVDGVEDHATISGRVVGLGDGVRFSATRRGACCGKSMGPP